MRTTLHYSAIYNWLYLPAPFGSLFDFFVSESARSCGHNSHATVSTAATQQQKYNCQLSLYCLLNIRHVGEVWLCDSCPQRFLLAEGQSYGGFVSHQILIMSLLRRVPARRLQVLHCHYFVKHRMSAKNNTAAAAAASKNVQTRVEAQG